MLATLAEMSRSLRPAVATHIPAPMASLPYATPRERESVAPEDQVSPKLEEMKMMPESTTAVWYCPVEDKDIERQFKLPAVVRVVHVTP